MERILRWLPTVAIVVGLATRSGAEATWLIRPCLTLIMLGAFVETRALGGWRPDSFLWVLLTCQVALGAGSWLALHDALPTVASAALILALTPTAVSAAAVASAAGADGSRVTSTIAASNLAACVTFPVALALTRPTSLDVGALAGPAVLVGATVVLPFAAALAICRFFPGSWNGSRHVGWRAGMRLLWAAILWTSASKVGTWGELTSGGSLPQRVSPLLLAVVAFVVFQAASRSAGAARRTEASICYGHKNSGLALLLTVDVFPIFVVATLVAYSLVQNVYFSYAPRRNGR